MDIVKEVVEFLVVSAIYAAMCMPLAIGFVEFWTRQPRRFPWGR